MADKQIRDKLKNFILITLGSVVYALSLSCFLDPNRLVPGGVSGIAVIINHTVGWLGTGTVIILLNIPLLIAGLVKFGRRFMLSTVYATISSSLLVELLNYVGKDFLPLTEDLLLAAVAGGALMALGLGLVFRGGGTTGGSDIVTKFLRLKYKHIRTGSIFLAVDSVVVIASAIVFHDIEVALYAALSLVVSAAVLDRVLYGTDEAKLVYIISDRGDEIADKLMRKLDVGVTFLEGQGAYTGNDKRVLMCAAHKRTFPRIREVVTEVDDMAFMIVSSAQEIFGEGFKNHRSGDL